MKTTLNKIRAHDPCASGWKKLLRNLGKTTPDDEPLFIATILESNGLLDALWCLQAVDGHDSLIRLYAVDCARMVQHLMTDKRSVAALDVAERFALGLATTKDLAAARAAAWAAASAAEWDAATAAEWDAATAAEWAAARAAAWAAASAAEWAAEWDAEWAAEWAAASAAEWAAEWDAASAAEWAAASDAARAARANLLALYCAAGKDILPKGIK